MQPLASGGELDEPLSRRAEGLVSDLAVCERLSLCRPGDGCGMNASEASLTARGADRMQRPMCEDLRDVRRRLTACVPNRKTDETGEPNHGTFRRRPNPTLMDLKRRLTMSGTVARTLPWGWQHGRQNSVSRMHYAGHLGTAVPVGRGFSMIHMAISRYGTSRIRAGVDLLP